jgi:uncharacterized protein (TIGR02186 family)
MAFVAAIAATVSGSAVPAAADRLVATLSSHHVMVTSNYTGVELTLFGTVEHDAAGPVRQGTYDLVVTVFGPRQALRARRKTQVLGVWVNTQARTFVDPPSYLAVLSNRPLAGIVDDKTRRRLQLGIADTPLPELIHNDIGEVAADPFRGALVRLMSEHGLYSEAADGVSFLTPTLFRAAIDLPAQVPIGRYDVAVRLFSDGKLAGETKLAFDIAKVGFEQFVVQSAQEHGLLYGLATALLALLTGWVASVTFRRD